MCLLTSLLAKPIAWSRKKMDDCTDRRILLLSELLHSIRGVKLSALEPHMLRLVGRERRAERDNAMTCLVWKGVAQFLYVLCTPVLMVVMLLGAHLADGEAVDAARKVI